MNKKKKQQEMEQETPEVSQECETPEKLTSISEMQLESMQKELKDHKDKYLRLLAEMENSRKRMQKEKHDTTRFAVENIITEILAPLDHFENALSFAHQTSEETQNWAKGFEMILTQFKDILASHKVTSFQSEGKQFDPHMHEVIEMEETEAHPDGTILQEFVKGYQCGDRILRPARVKVAKKSGSKKEEVNNEKHEGES